MFTCESGFVLYWMCTALRLDENPAIDVARWLAARSELPWMIYQGLSSRYPFSSDRHHAFILQAATDVQSECRQRGWPFLFNLETSDSQSRRMLRELAAKASMVIVEEMPTDPPKNFLNALAGQIDTPILAVDTACVVPMQLVGRAHDRAFAFRDATAKLRAKRVARAWPEMDAIPKSLDIQSLGYASIELQDKNLSSLIASCDVDHSIPPVSHTQGGFKAGYERWEAFKRSGLKKYDKLRNNALVDGVSRMSAYLHYGMVSPMRMAREAIKVGGEGAEKFLDEMLVWRELAYSYCFYNPEHGQIQSIPAWALRTLAEHQNDQRESLYSWDQLAHCQTDDVLWNAAQRSLLQLGELHNNVRMTWGKAILNWTADAEQALRTMLDLNHRYALDGRDPASYGGILWCLGQFDRPFSPEQKILGSVRPRPTSEHARRLNPTAYSSKILNAGSKVTSIAVVGAGLSGLMAALTLARQGFKVCVLDKSRGPAGRMCTRRTDHCQFDHGAQYFTVRSGLFRRYVESWQRLSVVQPWHSTIATYQNGLRGENSECERYVACPSMNSLGKYLAGQLSLLGAELRYDTPISKFEREPGAWKVLDENATPLGQYDQIVVAIPAPQAALLLDSQDEYLVPVAQLLRQQTYEPCWAVLAVLANPVSVDWGGAFINSGSIRWVARDQTKPGRSQATESVVIHAAGNYSKEHFEAQPSQVIEELIAELWLAVGHEPIPVLAAQAHRWRYSISQSSQIVGAFSDSSETLHFCGDWAHGGRVEGAFLSGVAAAGKIMRQVGLMVPTPTEDSELDDLPLFRM
ncbi:MAG: FAD-dependent oxidoreductase [Pirellulales bacterium]